jgi:hypothetical protein
VGTGSSLIIQDLSKALRRSTSCTSVVGHSDEDLGEGRNIAEKILTLALASNYSSRALSIGDTYGPRVMMG